jgi:hypothetical protein
LKGVVHLEDLSIYNDAKQAILSVNYKMGDKLGLLEKIINLENVKVVYPKGIFVNYNRDLVLVLLTETNIYLVDFKENMQIKKYRMADIRESIFIIHDVYYRECELTIKFEDGNEIKFSSKDDTNESWRHEFPDYIIKLYKALA